MTRVVANDSIFEDWLTHFLIKNVKANEVVLDVGANVGYFTILLAQIVGPGGAVLAVEPLFGDALRANLRLNESETELGRVEIFDAVLSDQTGSVVLYRPGRHDAAYASLHRVGLGDKKVYVSSLTLDSICENLRALTWLKMDVEGAEHNVLRGGIRTLERFGPNIVLGWSPAGLEKMGTQETALFQFLVDLGYELFGSCNNMNRLTLPTSPEWEHTVLATRNPDKLRLAPWDNPALFGAWL